MKMNDVESVTPLGSEIVHLARRHTIFDWTAQSAADPLPVERAKGVYFWTEMIAFMRFLRQEGLYTINRSNTFFTVPPLCITDEQLREGFAIIDRALDDVDRFVR
jgi:hypothetical protein